MDNRKFMIAMVAVFRIIVLSYLAYAVYGIAISNPFVTIVSAGVCVIFCRASANIESKLKDESEL